MDEDTFLHDETDPRYRGPAIPSRAFRMLQTMTDAAEASGDPTCGTKILPKLNVDFFFPAIIVFH